MTIKEAIRKRHSVRQYLDKPIEDEKIALLQEEIDRLNKESGLNIQLVTNEPKAFSGTMAHYGKFSGVTSYIAIVGPKGKDEEVGYFGEKLVLFAQTLELNTCWVALTFSKVKDAYKIGKGEKLYIVISLGYGANMGKPHNSKATEELVSDLENAPEWYEEGVKAALMAPTAVNQQKFVISRDGDNVTIKAKKGPYSKVDLGIVKCHFEIGAGEEHYKPMY